MHVDTILHENYAWVVDPERGRLDLGIDMDDATADWNEAPQQALRLLGVRMYKQQEYRAHVTMVRLIGCCVPGRGFWRVLSRPQRSRSYDRHVRLPHWGGYPGGPALST
ncbi:hypothetical protein GmRootV59_63170 (plasmid) [Variovorax sp. V59]